MDYSSLEGSSVLFKNIIPGSLFTAVITTTETKKKTLETLTRTIVTNSKYELFFQEEMAHFELLVSIHCQRYVKWTQAYNPRALFSVLFGQNSYAFKNSGIGVFQIPSAPINI